MADDSNLTVKIITANIAMCSPVKLGAKNSAGESTGTAPTATTDYVAGFTPFGSDYKIGDHAALVHPGQTIKVRLGATLTTVGVPLVLHATLFDRLDTATINVAGGTVNTQILGYLVDPGSNGEIVRMTYRPSMASV